MNMYTHTLVYIPTHIYNYTVCIFGYFWVVDFVVTFLLFVSYSIVVGCFFCWVLFSVCGDWSGFRVLFVFIFLFYFGGV